MELAKWLRHWAINPSPLTFWRQCLIALMCLIAILAAAYATGTANSGTAPILVASMGASVMIMLAVPSSPFATPWAFAGGQLVSGFTGVIVAYWLSDKIAASAVAVGLAVLFMQNLRCMHPPGAATVLVPVLSYAHSPQPNFSFLLNPLGANVAVLLLAVMLINRLVLRHGNPPQPAANQETPAATIRLAGISPADILQATAEMNQVVDVSSNELSQLFARLNLAHYARHHQVPACRDVMRRNVLTAEYDTEVESAWLMMHEHGLEVLPVLDRSRRVIGIVTRYDFLKNLKLKPDESFKNQWRAFIKTTPGLYADKPEAIGHIMTRKVKTLSASAPISESIPLVVNDGHHRIPIVDHENRFVGMVFLNELMSELFNHQLTQHA